MAVFKYTAADSDGNAVSGVVDADSADHAREQLEAQGLAPIDVEPSHDEASDEEVLLLSSPVEEAGRTPKDKTAESPVQTEAVSQAGQLIAAGVPLSAGLRALAEEAGTSQLRKVLSQMANRLDAGEDLNDVLSGDALTLPAYLKGLVRAGTRIGDLAGSIEHYVEFTRLRTRIYNRIRISLAYPMTLAAIGALIMGAVLFYLAPQFQSIFDDFGVELPAITSVMLELSALTVFAIEWWAITIPAIGAVVWYGPRLLRDLLGGVSWRRFLYLIPLFGPTLRFGALAEYCHLLAILIDNRIPLPEALRLAGDGVSDSNLREGSYRLSEQSEAGNLPGQVESAGHFPRDILNVMNWELGTGDGQNPGDALRGAGDVYSAHAEVHSRTITAALEPAVIIMVACMAGLFVVAMFMPLIKLLNDLS